MKMKQLAFALSLTLLTASVFAATTKVEDLPTGLIEHTTDAKTADHIDDEQLAEWAWEYLKKQEAGLSPEQRREYLKQEQEKKDALLDLPPPKAKLEIIPVTMDPAAQPIRIYLAPGWDSHLSVIDGNGSPWPIQYFSSGNNNFKLSQLGGDSDVSEEEQSPVSTVAGELEPKSTSLTNMNTLSKLKIVSVNRAGGTNMTLLLQGMKEVINVQLIANTTKYHPSTVLQLPRTGPYSSGSYVPTGVPLMSNDDVMRDIAMGGNNLPKSYKQIETDNPNVKAWMDGNAVFIRSPYYSKVPRPLEGQAGTGGYKAYRIPYLPAITMVGDGNEQIIVKLFKNRVVESNAKNFSY